MRFTTIIFDLDHTLLDSDSSEQLAFTQALTSIGIDAPEQHLPTYQTINMALWKRVELGELSPNDVKVERFAQLLAALDIDSNPNELGSRYLEGLGDNGELYPQAQPLLGTLAEHRLGLVTNGIGSVQRRRLERLDLDRHFSGVAISGEVGVSKPDPSIFSHLNFADWVPNETVIIGDSLSSDIAAGLNANIATCWYNPSSTSNLGPIIPTIEVQQLSDVPRALSAL